MLEHIARNPRLRDRAIYVGNPDDIVPDPFGPTSRPSETGPEHYHVPHRLGRYRAGQRMDYTTTDPDTIAAAIAAAIGREVDYQAVERDGAHRAAALLAELL